MKKSNSQGPPRLKILWTGQYGVPGKNISGPCGPGLIHADGGSADKEAEKGQKTKKQKDRERRQRLNNQREDDPIEVPLQYLLGLADPSPTPREAHDRNPHGIMVRTTKEGSMTEETMLDYAMHFVKYLPSEPSQRGPVLLFLDGHASRWSVPALQYLFNHQVHVFFLPSHTSMWSQPNDNAVNKSFHHYMAWATEELRRGKTQATTYFFNEVFRKAWEAYVRDERNNLLSKAKCNNATDGWERVGLEPCAHKSESWDDAKETLGKAVELRKKKSKRDMRSYEVRALPPERAKTLTANEVRMLRGQRDDEEPNLLVALFTANGILARWREQVRDELKKGDEAGDINQIVPKAETKAEELAMQLVEFVTAKDRMPVSKKKSKEEETQQMTDTILMNTPEEKSIELTYFNPEKNGAAENACAIRKRGNQWMVSRREVAPYYVSTDDLKERSVWIVHRPEVLVSSAEAKKNARKASRKRDRERNVIIKEAKAKGMVMRDKMMWELYRRLNERIKQGKVLDPGEWNELVEIIQNPLRLTLESVSGPVEVSISGAQASADERLVLDTIGERLIKSQEAEQAAREAVRKRRKTRHAPLHRGCDGFEMLDYIQRCDKAQEEEHEQDHIKKLTSDVNTLENCLQDFAEHREKQKGSQPVSSYWDPTKMTSTILKVFLRMFLPRVPSGGGKLSKNNPEKIAALRDCNLSQEVVDSKYEELQSLLGMWKEEMEGLLANENEPEAVDDSNNSEDDNSDVQMSED